MSRFLYSLARLRALQVVCETGGFTSAAHEIGLTQSAVSNQIKNLEDEVGAPLVERIGKSVKPTPDGERLIACTKRILRDLRETHQEIAVRRGVVAGDIVLAAGGTANTYLMPALLTEIRHRYPELRVHIRTGNTAPLIKALHELTVDVLVGTGPISDDKLEQEPFFDDAYVCVTAADDETIPDVVSPDDTLSRRLILYEKGGAARTWMDAWLATTDTSKLMIDEIESAEAQKTFARAGFGWALIPKIAVIEDESRGLLRTRPLSPPLVRPLVVVWRKDRGNNPAIRAVRQVFSEFSARASGEGPAVFGPVGKSAGASPRPDKTADRSASVSIRPMRSADGEAVIDIYRQGVETGNATLTADVPTWETWDAYYRADCRVVAVTPDGTVVGWAALIQTSSRPVYSGVADLSVYVDGDHRGARVGTALMSAIIEASEAAGVWTIRAHMFPENSTSMKLHARSGFRRVGVSERLGRTERGRHAGTWRDVLTMERRSAVVGLD